MFTSIFCVPPPPNKRPLKMNAKAKSRITKITRTATTPVLPPPPSPLSPIRLLLFVIGGLGQTNQKGREDCYHKPQAGSIYGQETGRTFELQRLVVIR